MSTPLSRSQRVQHNSSGKMIFKKKQKGGTQRIKCKKCDTEFINVFNANRNRMEKRCGCNPNET